MRNYIVATCSAYSVRDSCRVYLVSQNRPRKLRLYWRGPLPTGDLSNICNRDGGHSGGQEQKIIPPLGTNLVFYANSAKQILFFIQQHRCLVTLLQTNSVSFPLLGQRFWIIISTLLIKYGNIVGICGSVFCCWDLGRIGKH